MGGLSLVDAFANIPDPRLERRQRHKLIDIIVISVCAILCGCQGPTEIVDYAEAKLEWLKRFLELPNGIPSHDTFGRVLSILDPQAFQKAFYNWLSGFLDLESKTGVHIDGKFLRGSLQESGRPRSAIAIVNAWSSKLGICLGMKKSVLQKEQGEKRIMEELIEELFLKGCIVSIDANGATERIVSAVVKKEADYLIGLKANQEVLLRYAEILTQTPTQKLAPMVEKGHGRIEERVFEMSEVSRALTPSLEKGFKKHCERFENLNSFVKVTATRIIGEKTTTETRYYFTSLKDIKTASEVVRDHWSVENQLHNRLDVIFREDHCQVRLGHASENLAVIRRMCLSLLKQDIQNKKSLKRRSFACLTNNSYLEHILKLNTEIKVI